MLRRIVATGFAAAISICLSAVAQAGYVQNSVSEISMPITGSGWNAYLGGFDYNSSGNIVAYTGRDVVEVSPTGTILRTLYSGSSTLAGAFVKVNPSTGNIYFGESSEGTIKVMDSNGGGPTTLLTLANNYDMVIDSSGRLLVSAASADWSSTSLWSVNAGTGQATLFGNISGPSGPLAIGADGALYYGTATADWASTGTQSIFSWSSALLDAATGGGSALSTANATSVIDGTHNVCSMAFDGDGNLYYSTSQAAPAGIWKVSGGSQSLVTTANPQGFNWLTTLRYNPGTGYLDVNVGGAYDGQANPIGVIASVNPVPEPSCIAALACLTALAGAIRRRR